MDINFKQTSHEHKLHIIIFNSKEKPYKLKMYLGILITENQNMVEDTNFSLKAFENSFSHFRAKRSLLSDSYRKSILFSGRRE